MKQKMMYMVVLMAAVCAGLILTFLSAQRTQAQGETPQTPTETDVALGTAFTFQGRLDNGGSPANGNYDLQFLLFNAASGGTQVGSTLTKSTVTVTSGLFTVSLDFGSLFSNTALWIQIKVRPSGSGTFTTLSPRQALTAVPQSLWSQKAPWAGLTGVPAGFKDNTDDDLMRELNCTSGQHVEKSGSSWICTAFNNSHDHFGELWSGSGGIGLRLENTNGTGLLATGTTYGLYGESTANTGTGYGVYGSAASGQSAAIYGTNSATTGNAVGVSGNSVATSGVGVWGTASSQTGTTYGVLGLSYSTTGRGVVGNAANSTGVNYGVYGKSISSDGIGVYGYADSSTGSNRGVYGRSDSSGGIGAYGYASSFSGVNYGVYGDTNSASGYAGYFADRVKIAGNLEVVGTLSKSAGTFKIDHPLDPENRTLSHSFVESPDMMNVYNGNIILDENGAATVELPDYFQALNQDFRYQLTPIGGFAPLYIAQEIADNRFQIAGGAAGLKVSWQVTGIRHDAYAEAHRIVVEEDKSPSERGTYLSPEAFGQPASRGVNYALEQAQDAALKLQESADSEAGK